MKRLDRDEEWRLDDVGHKASPPEDRRLQVRWAAVFACNLPLAGLLGLIITWPHGTIGVVLAVGVLFGLGHLACIWAQSLARDLIVGGRVVALLQCVVVVHLMAGVVGLGLGDAISRSLEPIGSPDAPLRGFLATLFTGGFLMAFAFVFGSPMRLGMLLDEERRRTANRNMLD